MHASSEFCEGIPKVNIRHRHVKLLISVFGFLVTLKSIFECCCNFLDTNEVWTLTHLGKVMLEVRL